MVNERKNGNKPLTASLIIAGSVIIFVLLLSTFFNFFQYFELKGYDFLFGFKTAFNRPSGNIVISAIDDWSIGNEEAPELMVWPFPRNVYASALANLKKAGAKAVCIDIEFSSESLSPVNDRMFGESAKKSGNCIGVYTLQDERINISNRVMNVKRPIYPINSLETGMAGLGYTGYKQDKDKYIRSGEIFQNMNGASYYCFALKVLGFVSGKTETALLKELEDRSVLVKGPESPVKDSVLIDFCGPAKTIKTIPFVDLLKGKNLENYKGKVVFLGSTSSVLHDEFPTPCGVLPGVEIHANMFDMLQKGAYVRKAPFALTALFLVLIVGVTTFFAYKLNPIKSIFAVLLMACVYVLLVSVLLANFNYYIEFTMPLWALVFAYIGNVAYKAVTEGRKKEIIKKTFQRYVSRDVVEEILKNPEGLALGGKRQHMTILFSDIRNFTPMSESLKAEEVVELLNMYFSEMTGIIFKYRGTLDKYIGDAVMALFGAPKELPNSEELAVRTAIEMQEKMKDFRATLKIQGKNEIAIGVGLNAGEVIVGNIGSGQQINYTVIGDVANTASRLESLTKEYKRDIIISQSVYDKVKDIVVAEDLGEATVKGKLAKVKIYAVLGLKKK